MACQQNFFDTIRLTELKPQRIAKKQHPQKQVLL